MFHFCLSRSRTHDICNARLGNIISRLETLKIMLPDQDTNKIQVAYYFECLKTFDYSELLSSFEK